MMRPTTATRAAAAAAFLVAVVLLAAPLVLPADDGGDGAEGAQQSAEGAVNLAPSRSRFVAGWLPYWKIDEALASFTENAELFTDLTTFFHYVTGPNGTLSDRTSPDQIDRVIGAARDRGLPVLAAVLDDTGRNTMRQLLADPARRAAHIQQLLTLVDVRGYDGIDIDYENFAFADGSGTWAQTRPVWVAFISELGAALTERGKFLTVAVPPQFNTANDSSSGYWVYDWPAIAPHIDSLRVMTYDYSTNALGPGAPQSWVARATEFGVAALGPDKFRVGVATYGRDWVVAKSGGGCGAVSLSNNVTRPSAEFLAIAEQTGSPVQFNEEYQEAYLAYTQPQPDCSVSREAFFSDAASVAAKADLALRNGSGIALWSLGGEDPAMWDALREARRGR
jgi:spore germination protein YaaH